MEDFYIFLFLIVYTYMLCGEEVNIIIILLSLYICDNTAKIQKSG